MAHCIERIGHRISSIPRISTFNIATSITHRARICHAPAQARARVQNSAILSRMQQSCFSSTSSSLYTDNDNQPSQETKHISRRNSSDNSSNSSGSGPSIHTVNNEEVAKFAAMSDEWWAPQGPFKMLHLMNPPRIRYICNRLEVSGTLANTMNSSRSIDSTSEASVHSRKRFPLQGLSILDVGCGGGLLAEALARLGAKVTGLDASNENIQIARIHSKKDPLLNGGGPGSLEYRYQTAEKLLDEGRQFDVVCSMEVIEHVDNPAQFLKVLGELVKPNGDLILSTISRTAMSYFTTIFCAEHLLRMVPVGTHHWSKFITAEELRNGVQDLAKCQVLNIQGIGFNPLSGQWELMKNRDRSSDFSAGLFSFLGSPIAESANYLLAAKKTSAS